MFTFTFVLVRAGGAIISASKDRRTGERGKQDVPVSGGYSHARRLLPGERPRRHLLVQGRYFYVHIFFTR